MQRQALLTELETLLQPFKFRDYAPNGLQVEGKDEIKRVVTGVTACQALLDEAVKLQADAVLVHHGYFWKGEPAQITGMKKRRLQTLLANDINLFAYHLPLDAHPELGNNAQLCRALGIEVERGLEPGSTVETSVCVIAQTDSALTPDQLVQRIERTVGELVLYESGGEHAISRIAVCTGGGQDFIAQAAEQGADAFITGEVSERTIHVAREMGIHFFAAGHHATERGGIRVLGDYLAKQHDLDVTFVDIPNPV